MRRSLLALLLLLSLAGCATAPRYFAVEPRPPTFAVIPEDLYVENILFANHVELALLASGFEVYDAPLREKLVEETKVVKQKELDASVASEASHMTAGVIEKKGEGVEVTERYFTREDLPVDYIVYTTWTRGVSSLRITARKSKKILKVVSIREALEYDEMQAQFLRQMEDFNPPPTPHEAAEVAVVRLKNSMRRTMAVLPFNDSERQLGYARAVEKGLLQAGMELVALPEYVKEIEVVADSAKGEGTAGKLEGDEKSRARSAAKMEARKISEKYFQRDDFDADFEVKPAYLHARRYSSTVKIVEKKTRRIVAVVRTSISPNNAAQEIEQAIRIMYGMGDRT